MPLEQPTIFMQAGHPRAFPAWCPLSSPPCTEIPMQAGHPGSFSKILSMTFSLQAQAASLTALRHCCDALSASLCSLCPWGRQLAAVPMLCCAVQACQPPIRPLCCMQRGHTPLFYATAAGQIESLRELLDSGASVNQAGTVRSTGQDCTLT